MPSGNEELSRAQEQIILNHLATWEKDKLAAQVHIRLFENYHPAR